MAQEASPTPKESTIDPVVAAVEKLGGEVLRTGVPSDAVITRLFEGGGLPLPRKQ